MFKRLLSFKKQKIEIVFIWFKPVTNIINKVFNSLVKLNLEKKTKMYKILKAQNKFFVVYQPLLNDMYSHLY